MNQAKEFGELSGELICSNINGRSGCALHTAAIGVSEGNALLASVSIKNVSEGPDRCKLNSKSSYFRKTACRRNSKQACKEMERVLTYLVEYLELR